MGLLDASTASLVKLRATIAREQLVDAAAHDKVKIFQLRVLTLVLPKARLMMAAYQLAHLAALYSSQQGSLQQLIYAAQANGKDATAAQSIVNDLAARVAAMNRASSAAVGLVQGLSASGYPANKPSLLSARSWLVGGKVAGGQAVSDIGRARSAIP